MDTYYEYIRTKVKGMISSSYMDLYEFKLDFDSFIEYLEKDIRYSLSDSNFDYHVFYDKDKIESQRDFSHYVTLDNGIYVEIKTCSKDKIELDMLDMTNTFIQSVIAYCGQSNNTKLIKFMNVVNSFVIKNKEEQNNAE